MRYDALGTGNMNCGIAFVAGWYKMAEPSKVIHVRNVGHEISEVISLSLYFGCSCVYAQSYSMKVIVFLFIQVSHVFKMFFMIDDKVFTLNVKDVLACYILKQK